MPAGDPIALLLAGQYPDPETGELLAAESRAVVIEDSLAGSEADLIAALGAGRHVAVVSDRTTHDVLGARIERALGRFAVQSIVLDARPHADDATVERLVAALAPSTDLVVAVGSGTLNDLTKMVAFRRGCPQAIFATAPSMNGYTSLSASITSGGMKRSFRTQTPLGVYFDLKVLAAAPARLIRAGLGDSACRPTAQADWLLSHLLLDRPYREAPFALLADDEQDLFAHTGALLAGDLEMMRHLVRILVLSGFGMTICNGSYPASQGEHLISHYVEMTQPVALPHSFHGEQIAVCTVAMAALQEQMLARDAAPVLHPSRLDRADLVRHFGPVIGEGCWVELEQKLSDTARTDELNARLASHWDAIRARIDAVRVGAAKLRGLLADAGAPVEPAQVGLAGRAVRECDPARERDPESLHVPRSRRRQSRIECPAMYRALGCALTLAICSCWSSARPPSAPQRDLHIALAVEQIQLANGLKVIVVPSPGASDVSVTVRYGVGSSDDPVGREGLAHLVEHLMFEHVHGDQALFDILEDRALSFTGVTTLDSTVYSEKGAPSQLEELLEIEVARLGQACSDIPEAAFVRQREIVRNELRERDADDRVQAALHQAVYAADHPFGRRSTVESVAAMTRDQACELAAKRYVPSNAVVVVSGPTSLHDAKTVLDRTLGRIPAASAEPARAKPFDPRARRATMTAPVKQPWFLLAWPLPTDPAERTRVRAVASMAATLVQTRINGEVSLLELGAGSAREIVIAVAPSSQIKIADALDHTKDEIARMGPWFGSGIYEHVKNRAVYRLAASLESGIERDRDLAEIAASGRDAGSVTDEALHALLSMSRDDANDLVHSSLDPNKAIVVMLRPSGEESGGVDSLAPPFHEERHRKTEDPAEARKPMENAVESTSFEGVETYALKNGLQVVLMPLSTMPTLEVRLSLPVGTGDEAARQRGIALVAADAIDPPFDNVMFQFIQAGGRVNAVVGFDQTVFSVQGLAANLDLLLAGLSTTVRDGGYDHETVRDVVKWRGADTLDARDGLATGTWREALFGPKHPYRYASLWDHADRSASDLGALERFQAQHYLPDGATLVIAGQFDTTVAQRWVDFHFEKWSGTPPIRSDERAPFQPFAFAQVLKGSQLDMKMAFSTSSKNAIAVEIVAEMLDEVIADVREQLAASYGLHASVVRRRLSTTIQLAGSIDANRAAEAIALLRDRLARLRERGDAAASQFVSARRRVLTRHSSVDARAASLADSVIEQLSFDESPRFNHVDVTLARSMTLDSVAALLDGIELSRAAIMLRGPEAALKAAYAAIGREPVFLK